MARSFITTPRTTITNRFFPGNFAHSVQFPGNGGYINVTNTIPLNPSTFSVFCWIAPSSFDSGDFKNNVLSKEGVNTGFGIRMGDGKLNMFIGTGGGNPQAEAGAKNIYTGLWQHVGGMYDGTTIALYLNGGSIAANNAASGYTTNSLDIRIGRAQTNNSRDYSGYVNGVLYYSGTLTPAQVQDIYYGRNIPTQNLLGYWKCDDGSGTTVADSSGNSNTGTFVTGSGLPAWSTNVFLGTRSIVT